MRVGANHAGNKHYVLNSFKVASLLDPTEVSYSVAENVVSRKSHYMHEAQKSEYAQATELYKRVMSDKARANLHQNTKKYLAQIYNIAPEYRKADYDLLLKQEFAFSEGEELSKSAHEFCKESKFLPVNNARLVGYPASVYH
ncbi:MAG: hypothetical protein Q9191_003985 [Dirinaria sp. TL-2023a]